MKKTVLLIEDLPVMQNLYGSVLKEEGYQVDISPDGQDALEKVKDKEYDFVLTDMLLPKVSGIQFLEKFQDRPKHTKVVVLTDFKEQDAMEKAQKLGASAYLIKTETLPQVLLDKLEELGKDK